MNKKLILPVTLGSLALVAALGFAGTKVFASDTNTTMIDSLAQKLGVESTKVETAMEEIRTERHAQMQQEREESLQKAVTDGVITDAQKEAILQKQEERRAAREKERAEMQQWYQDQGIDHDKLRDYMGDGRGGHGRDGHGGGMGIGI